MGDLCLCSFQAEDFKVHLKVLESQTCLGLGDVPLCYRAVMDDHQRKAAYKKTGCNSSAQLTGQHKWCREAGSWALTPPLLARYAFYCRNSLKLGAFCEYSSGEVTREIYGGSQ